MCISLQLKLFQNTQIYVTYNLKTALSTVLKDQNFLIL